MKKIVSKNYQETIKIARSIASYLDKGMVILLKGDLGVGKTIFAKGIAEGLSIDEPVTSPTFALLHEYEGSEKLYHFDLYRLYDPEEIYDIGYDEYIYGEGISLIEWPERMDYLLPEDYLLVNIKRLEEPDERLLEFSYKGANYEALIDVLVEKGIL